MRSRDLKSVVTAFVYASSVLLFILISHVSPEPVNQPRVKERKEGWGKGRKGEREKERKQQHT